MSGYLLDHRIFRKIAPGESPLLFTTRYGVRGRIIPTGIHGSFTGPLGHTDDILRACAEIGLSSDDVLYTIDGEASIRHMIQDSTARFEINQELEWSSEALARYLAPQSSWINHSGKEISFNDIASSLLKRVPGEGTCLGTHVPYA
ncbi:MAG: hypothetical protein ACRDF4_02315, partial [Rhabdochlamydiaceae bacterium]